ncbi:MAG: hypothetical protein LBG64_02990, partial [Pseudomonadales bacterium]|nr:hypothetical protein [Pseudomonadales bacterium]
YLFFSNAAAVDAADATTATADAAAYAASTTAYVATADADADTADADADTTATTVVVDDVDDVDADAADTTAVVAAANTTVVTGLDLDALRANATPVTFGTQATAAVVTPAVEPTVSVLGAVAPASGALDFDGIMMHIDRALAEGYITRAEAIALRERAMEIVAQQEVVIESPRFDATGFTRALLSEHAVVDGQTIDLLTEVFDETSAAVNYRPILFPLAPPVGGHLIDLRPGQVLYLSAGHYQLVLPDGRVVLRAFGEDRVANDYFAMPGRYFLISYVVTETPERGQFAAIGGAIFSQRPSLAAELQGSFMRPMNLTVSTASHRQASQDGMGKEQSFSLFVDENGDMRQVMTERLGDRVNIRVIEADLHVGIYDDQLS